jgi:murein hydrolase activator
MSHILVLLFCLFFTTTFPVASEEQELQRVLREIDTLQGQLNQARGQFSAAERQLQEQELALARNHREILAAERSLATSDDLLRDMQTRGERLEAEKVAQEQQLHQELALLYRSGRREPWSLLLNFQDSRSYNRMLYYYRELLKERQRVLGDYLTKLEEIESNQRSLADERQHRAEALARLNQARQSLEQSHTDRERALAELERVISSTEATIATREADRARLEALVERISSRLSELAIPPDDGRPFEAIRGQCNWPASGRLESRFGSVRAGSMRWDGVMIAAEAGQNVTAVHRGRAVFADYLRGYGMLVILDHGDDYLTLYGHNQSLLVEAGEWVFPGQAIARVGNSGGLRDPGLYFEIRKSGTPQDPSRWCR